ncbi:unnamed protein product [Phyllotreta striolata]|uniref:PDZ domain-containing protein n=1 Tax=Phyllotreta striolata TaxID=444603 RepID=A0A9N9TGX0_PHYSR|nr:unnamed protein product [Phyllotreta striolata]
MSQTAAENFVTVVSVGARVKEVNENANFKSADTDYITVLTIGEEASKKNAKDVVEEVIVYRLPGERLGFGLKFEGGTKANEFVKRLFIQSCAANSPASRVTSSWGKLTEGDEVLEIDMVPVNTMTRIDCVRCLKESNVAIKLLVRHIHIHINENETKIKSINPPLVISAEEKRVPPPPPPVPPRKISRKLLKNVNNNNIIPKETGENIDTNKQKKLQSPRGSIRSYDSPDASRRNRRFSDGSLGPPDAEVYVDLFLQESTQSLSESDETGSTISTVIDRFGSFPTTTTSSFSGSLPSTPTAIQRELDLSNINIYDDEDNFIITKGLGKPISLSREENNNIILDDINPLCFQDAPLSYGNESTKNIIPDEIDNIKEDPIVLEETKPVLKKPQVPPRSRDTHLNLTKIEDTKNTIENLPRLVDFVPKSLNGLPENENTEEIENNEIYKGEFDYYDKDGENIDNFTNGVDLYSSKWSLSSQLATIGEVEEETSSDFNSNRTISKLAPVVIVENIDKIEDKSEEEGHLKQENEGTNGIMETLPSDSRQPPDGHEFPDFIEARGDSTNQIYPSFKDDFAKQPLQDILKQNDLLSQTVSASNGDLRSTMYESIEDLKCAEYVPESNLLHVRSQSLIDVSALNKQKNSKWNQLFEQRRKGLSKLKGLVIPESVESDSSPNVSIPEIKSQPTAATIYYPAPKADNIPAIEEHLPITKSVEIPSWSSNSSTNVPKYSPAFRRKSLQVYSTNINSTDSTNAEYIKYCDKTNTTIKGSKISDDELNPPKSLESISSPTRSDCSFDYAKSKNGVDIFQKSASGKTEDESDNDSAVSSSQSSYNSRYSPPASPTRSCEINHYSRKLEDEGKGSKNRLLKPSSVEAINRKNILASAKCSSGKDLKIGSPVIRRKQEEAQLAETQVVDKVDNSKEVDKKPTIIEETPCKSSFSSQRAVPVGSSDEKPNEIPPIKETKIRKDILFKPLKNVPTNGNTGLPSKIVLKSRAPAITTPKSMDIFTTRSSRTPATINVKALKQSFENLTSVLPVPQKVPVSKPAVASRASKMETTISSVSNGTSHYADVESKAVQKPIPQKRKSDVKTRTVALKMDSDSTSLGINIAGGVDEDKDVSIHRIRYASIAYNDGRLKKGDKIISVNGVPTKGLTHEEASSLLKERVNEFSITIEEGNDVTTSPANTSVTKKNPSNYGISSKSLLPKEIETKKSNNTISITKDGAGLGFSIEGGRDSPKGDVPLLIKKIFTGGAAEKSGELKVGDEIIQINDINFTSLTRIEAWNAMKKIPEGKVNIYIFR